MQNNKINLERITNDINGNPRYVCHFTEIINEADRLKAKITGAGYISELYKIAIKKANKIGGKKYHTKRFGGGVVFQSYNTDELERHIKEL
jgi:hypothetical protein